MIDHTYSITNSVLDQNKSQIEIYLFASKKWMDNLPTQEYNDAIIRTDKPYSVTKELVDNCDNSTRCYFYLTVNSTISTYFTLLVVDNTQKSIQLYDGMI